MEDRDDAFKDAGPGAIGDAAFRYVIDAFRSVGARAIVEFGSGASTAALASALPDAEIVSIEHDAAWTERVRARLEERGLRNARVEHVTLSLGADPHTPGLGYVVPPEAFPPRVDAVLVDGPPFFSFRGRESCLYRVYDRLRVGGVVVLDDCNREAERAIVKNWLEVYAEGISLEVVDLGHGLARLVKTREVVPAWGGPTKEADKQDVERRIARLRELLASLDDSVQRISSEEMRAHWSAMRSAYGVPPSTVSLPMREKRARLDELRALLT